MTVPHVVVKRFWLLKQFVSVKELQLLTVCVPSPRSRCALETVLAFVTSEWSFLLVAVQNGRGHQVSFHCSVEGVELCHLETTVPHGTDERRSEVHSF